MVSGRGARTGYWDFGDRLGGKGGSKGRFRDPRKPKMASKTGLPGRYAHFGWPKTSRTSDNMGKTNIV